MITTMTNSPQAEEWKISKRGRSCSVCQREFKSEEVLYSGIAEIEGRFERRDVCVPCWDKKPELFFTPVSYLPKRKTAILQRIWTACSEASDRSTKKYGWRLTGSGASLKAKQYAILPWFESGFRACLQGRR